MNFFILKKYKIVSIILILIITITGCSQVNHDKNKDIETHIIVDSIGRSVEVPTNVERIACMYTVSGHIVTMLGEGDKIVAVTNGLKRDKLLHKINPSILDTVTAKSSGSINIEELIKVNPDIVLVDRVIGTNQKEKEKLEKFNIPYLIVDFHSIEEQQYLVEMIGKVVGNEEKATEFNNFYDEIINSVRNITNTIPDEKKFKVYHSVNEVLRTDSSDSLGMEWTTIAGCKNISKDMNLEAEADDYYTNVEQILLLNPEVILVNEQGVDEYIKTQPMFSPIDAVVNDRIYLLPVGISRWGHTTSIETVLAIPYTVKKLYPDYAENIDVEKITKDFYQNFFNYSLSEDELNHLMSGKDMRLGKDETN